VRRFAIVAAALIAAQMGSAQAEVLKRDIYGFTTGMSLAEVKTQAQKRNCDLTPDETKAHIYRCTKVGEPIVAFLMGDYLDQVYAVGMNLTGSTLTIRDICLQFMTDCDAVASGETSVLDLAMQLGLNIIDQGNHQFVVTLYNHRVATDDKRRGQDLDQVGFVNTLATQASRYERTRSNDFQQEAVWKERKDTLCTATVNVKDWVGTVGEVTEDINGNASLTINIGEDIWLETIGGALIGRP